MLQADDASRSRTSNLGLVPQNTQWLLLTGVYFVVSAYLQVVRGYNAIETGVILTAATATVVVIGLFGLVAARRPPTRLVPRTFQAPSTDVGRPQ